MSYLLDKKIKRNIYIRYIILIVFLIVFFIFRFSIFNSFSFISHFVFQPVLAIGNSVGEKISNTASYFYFKKTLHLENEDLKSKLVEQEARITNYNSILDENLKIKEILGRKSEKMNMVLGSILSKTNQSIYNTLIIDVGIKNNILVGQMVFALGNIPIGRIAEVYNDSAKVVLFSNPGEETEVVVSGHDVYMKLTGRGGGNFEMILPRDFVLEKGTQVVLPGIIPHVVGVVQTIISDPRDAYQKALLVSPVNIAELKFVEVEK